MNAKTAKEKKVEDSLLRESAVGMMIERFEGHLKLLAESFDAKFGSLEKKMNEGFDEMKVRFDKFEEKTEENFEIVKNYLSNVTDDLDRITTEIKGMKAEPEKIDFDRVAELEKEVEHLKKEINKQGKLIQLKLCA